MMETNQRRHHARQTHHDDLPSMLHFQAMCMSKGSGLTSCS